MKIRLPTLRTVVQDAHKNGAVANRFRVSPEEAARIRRAEKSGGHDAGLHVVLRILREKNQAWR
jgi:hypothetical protein